MTSRAMADAGIEITFLRGARARGCAGGDWVREVGVALLGAPSGSRGILGSSTANPRLGEQQHVQWM
jgi:hypothetical protein